MPNSTVVGADQIVNHSMFATAPMSAYSLPDATSTVNYNFNNGDLIGNVYSYVQDANGQVWWMFYVTDADNTNQNASYVKQDATVLNVPDLPEILQTIAAKQKAANDLLNPPTILSTVTDFAKQYLPWIIGAVVISILIKSEKK